MVLQQYYTDGTDKVYLEDVINDTAFYRMGQELITATIEFFTSKYSLIK